MRSLVHVTTLNRIEKPFIGLIVHYFRLRNFVQRTFVTRKTCNQTCLQHEQIKYDRQSHMVESNHQAGGQRLIQNGFDLGKYSSM